VAHRIFVVAAFVSTGCLLGPATDRDGTYLRTFDAGGNPVQVSEPVQWRRYAGTDCLRLERRGPDEIFFEVVVNEASGHSCSASGTARRQNRSQFEADLETLGQEGTDCHVRLQFLRSGIVVEGWNPECRFYCGAGAILEAEFTRNDRLASSVACEVSPVPDLEALERAAERGLRQLEERTVPPQEGEVDR
jgi:hypothetical protein